MSAELHNLNIERAVLSSLLFDPDEAILYELQPSDLYLPFHQRFLSACQDLAKQEKPIDEEFVRMELGEKNFDEVAMLDLMAANPISDPRPYIRTIKELAQKRQLTALSSSIKKQVIEEEAEPLRVIDGLIRNAERIAESDGFAIARKTMAYAKAGEPEFMATAWLPIPKATVSMIVAPGGTGKTWLTLQLAIRMAREDAGRRIFLWLSEDPEGIVKSRYDAIREKILIGAPGTEDAQIAVSNEDPILLLETHGRTATLSPKFYALRRELREYDVIVIDPLLAFFGGDENDNSQARIFMQPFLNWARSENKTIIFVHHSRKSDGEGGSRARGAGALVDAARCVYDMDKFYITSNSGRRLDPARAHMRRITLTKDNYGAAKYLDGFAVDREITPKTSAREIEITYEDARHASMPVL